MNDLSNDILLWSGTAGVGGTITLSEPFTNFYDLVFMFNQGTNLTWHVTGSSNYIKIGTGLTSDNGGVGILIFANLRTITDNKNLPVQAISAININLATGAITVSTGQSIARVYGVRRRI